MVPLDWRRQRLSRLVQPRDVRHAVKIAIERQNPIDVMSSHHREMQRIPSRQLGRQYELLGAFEVFHNQGEDLVDDSGQDVKGGLDGVPPIDRRVAMQDFLQHFDIGDEPLVGIEIFVEELAGTGFVRMASSHEVHGNVGIDENQSEPIPYPRSICSIISSISATGNSYCIARRTA